MSREMVAQIVVLAAVTAKSYPTELNCPPHRRHVCVCIVSKLLCM